MEVADSNGAQLMQRWIRDEFAYISLKREYGVSNLEEERRIRRGLQLPEFNGRNCNNWIQEMEEIFHFFQLNESEKMKAVIMSLVGEASWWFEEEQQRRRFYEWSEVKILMWLRFGSSPTLWQVQQNPAGFGNKVEHHEPTNLKEKVRSQKSVGSLQTKPENEKEVVYTTTTNPRFLGEAENVEEKGSLPTVVSGVTAGGSAGYFNREGEHAREQNRQTFERCDTGGGLLGGSTGGYSGKIDKSKGREQVWEEENQGGDGTMSVVTDILGGGGKVVPPNKGKMGKRSEWERNNSDVAPRSAAGDDSIGRLDLINGDKYGGLNNGGGFEKGGDSASGSGGGPGVFVDGGGKSSGEHGRKIACVKSGNRTSCLDGEPKGGMFKKGGADGSGSGGGPGEFGGFFEAGGAGCDSYGGGLGRIFERGGVGGICSGGGSVALELDGGDARWLSWRNLRPEFPAMEYEKSFERLSRMEEKHILEYAGGILVKAPDDECSLGPHVLHPINDPTTNIGKGGLGSSLINETISSFGPANSRPMFSSILKPPSLDSHLIDQPNPSLLYSIQILSAHFLIFQPTFKPSLPTHYSEPSYIILIFWSNPQKQHYARSTSDSAKLFFSTYPFLNPKFSTLHLLPPLMSQYKLFTHFSLTEPMKAASTPPDDEQQKGKQEHNFEYQGLCTTANQGHRRQIITGEELEQQWKLSIMHDRNDHRRGRKFSADYYPP